jgi:hypothetical protein
MDSAGCTVRLHAIGCEKPMATVVSHVYMLHADDGLGLEGKLAGASAYRPE